MTYALSEPLQKAVYAALVNDAGVAALVGSDIYDAPLPQEVKSAPTDYILLGSETVRDRSSKTTDGAIHDLTVGVYSNAEGFSQSKQIAAAICDALLDATLPLERGNVVCLRFLKARADAGAPPNRRRIRLTFRAFVEDS